MNQNDAQKPKWKTWQKILLGCIVGFIVLMVFAVNSPDNSAKLSDQTKSTKKTESETPEITVTAIKLATDYESNEIAAQKQYQGKIVLVSGTVDDIGLDILNKPYIVLSGGNEFSLVNVQCMIKNKDEAANLAKGDKVSVQGKVSGKMMNVLIEHCILK